MTNKELCERYPFLLPRDWEDKVPKGYDYSYTKLDEMPVGWRIAFGEQMCADIMEILEKENTVEEYRVLQIKEKFGELRWYSNYYNEELENIIRKYTELSRETCIRCGKPAEFMNAGWMSAFCGDCVPWNKNREERLRKKLGGRG